MVLLGAKAFALPTKLGQWLEVEEIDEDHCEYRAFDKENVLWLSAKFDLNGGLLTSNSLTEAKKLESVLRLLNLKKDKGGWSFSSKLDFDRNWGLGSSSTFLANLANASSLDAFDLFFRTQTGSGYDIAVALSRSPLFYVVNNQQPEYQLVEFNPLFKSQLFFVYLEKKQNSEKEVKGFLDKPQITSNQIELVGHLSEAMAYAKNLVDFGKAMEEHEGLLSNILGKPSIEQTRFRDFPGKIKSLGAWGGDFALAACEDSPLEYFSKRGFRTVLSFQEMIG